ncbi:hypothetical protein FJY63_00265 [Candidatus Sumerlaeota bacterium]|nr:hypothetical protein [Candidatus Sumerlaeota bacterium]
MDVLNVVLGGTGGAIISAGVAYWIYRKSRKPPTGKAYEILIALGKILEEPEGEYYFTRSADDNFHVANHIYSHADGEIIATAFHEDPSTYGERDLVRAFKYGGSLFTRITCEEVCGLESEKKAREHLSNILKGATLVVIPKGEGITRIDGVFCRFNDNTHLSFIAFRHPKNQSKNKGVVFRDGIAESFFEYYRGLLEKYGKS